MRGGSGDPARGAACTPRWLAERLGTFDLDPFCNERSHVAATTKCMLERGDDGLLENKKGPGWYRSQGMVSLALPAARVWIQPPYDIVDRAFEHYRHTRWTALLRFDPRPGWFHEIYNAAELVAVVIGPPGKTVFNFELAPGVAPSSNSFPHALYYRRAEDAPPAVLERCIAWRKRAR